MSMRAFPRPFYVLLGGLAVLAAVAGACGGSNNGGGSNGSASTQNGGAGGMSAASGMSNGNGMGGIIVPVTVGSGGSTATDGGPCLPTCSTDHTAVTDCNGKVLLACPAGQACDLNPVGCADACVAAAANQSSVGCDYYATRMDMDYADQCYAVYIANTWNSPAHITVEYSNYVLPTPDNYIFIPSGMGQNITYGAYNAMAGLPKGQVAVLFLGGALAGTNPAGGVPCPAAVTKTAVANGSLVQGTAKGHSFHITTDVPVVAYQINPYGGGSAAITGASLLLPTSVWDTNYIAVTAAPAGTGTYANDVPSFNIISATDGNMITLLPSQAIMGGGTGAQALPAGPTNTPYMFTLNKGEQAQFSQAADLSGTVIQSTAPVGLMAGNPCMQEPVGTAFCDHGEQMIPPVKALGNEYVGVMFRPRTNGDAAYWRLVGALDGTTLTYSPSAPAGAPTTLNAGQVAEFSTATPFVVSSQDDKHPFMLFTLMTGSQWTQLSTLGYGDPDYVLSVATRQYLNDYVFFTDPTYPDTNLVIVRAPTKDGTMEDVNLDCMNTPLTGWQSVGNYQWTRVDLTMGNFKPQGSCSSGRHEISSKGTFGLWVWGWGGPDTQGGTCDPNTLATFTCNVSYGYPGGMNVQSINPVIIPPVAK